MPEAEPEDNEILSVESLIDTLRAPDANCSSLDCRTWRYQAANQLEKLTNDIPTNEDGWARIDGKWVRLEVVGFLIEDQL